jgi:ferritin-like metal-binding protein YciE
MKIELLEDLYIEELRDLYDAEKKLGRMLPKLAKAATAPELQEAFKTHTKETKAQIVRLEQVFKRLDQAPEGKKCKAMNGLLAEAKDFMAEEVELELRDVGLITAAQKIEHYEIASYGCVATHAGLLGFEQDAQLLHQTLVEEKATDEKLNLLAKGINLDAAKGETPEQAHTA